jgi:hypothetical protein
MGTKNIYERFVWFDNQVRARKYPLQQPVNGVLVMVGLSGNMNGHPVTG